jgi:hypothetical protein
VPLTTVPGTNNKMYPGTNNKMYPAPVQTTNVPRYMTYNKCILARPWYIQKCTRPRPGTNKKCTPCPGANSKCKQFSEFSDDRIAINPEMRQKGSIDNYLSCVIYSDLNMRHTGCPTTHGIIKTRWGGHLTTRINLD